MIGWLPRVSALLLVMAACTNNATPADVTLQATTISAGGAATLPAHLRVAELNTEMKPGETIARALRDEPDLAAADLVILEEVHREPGPCSGACKVGSELGFYTAYAPGHVNGKGTDGVAVMSRSPILSARVIELPYFSLHYNSQRKAAIAATVSIDGTLVTIYAVHLDNRITVAERRAQMAPILADADRQTTPVLIAGDFNTSPFTWLTHVFPVPTGTQDDRLEEFVRSHGFATPTKDVGATSHFLAMKLDAIYTRGLAVSHVATSDADDISDHLAVWADVSLNLAKL